MKQPFTKDDREFIRKVFREEAEAMLEKDTDYDAACERVFEEVKRKRPHLVRFSSEVFDVVYNSMLYELSRKRNKREREKGDRR